MFSYLLPTCLKCIYFK